ncbi:MAG: YdeI family protein [Chthoniobacterales bacterium]
MIKKDPRVDAYISSAAEFARPILKHIRKVVHAGCPDVQETVKWSMPHFDYKGIMCGMAAFKQHCSFGFWRAAELALPSNGERESEGMGHFGRITSLSDLPDEKKLIGYVRKAVALKDAGVKAPLRATTRPKRTALVIPAYFTAALAKNKKAQKTFESFNYSQRKEYVRWITEAKREETRKQRLATAIEWLAQGKPRNWKYQPK